MGLGFPGGTRGEESSCNAGDVGSIPGSGRLISPAPFFFLKIALAVWGLLCFHTNCEFFCPSSVKNTIGSLTGTVLNLYIALGSIVVFIILILPIQEHSVSLRYLCGL